MLKTLILAGGLALAGLATAPSVSAASLGNQADVGSSASTSVELAQYYYGGRRGYRRGYGYRGGYRPRFYGGYGYRPRYRYYGY